ncbi:MAG TPA: glycoside hydrolase family 18 protein [Verrucomicrobiae bacterium]|nr:glycoside hydrolase family 18 protein [Verrucomicrobiae bacterium]
MIRCASILLVAVAAFGLGACSPGTAPLPGGSAIQTAPAPPFAAKKKKKPELVALATRFSYAAGTISVVNGSGKAASLSNVELTFADADPITSVWGTPWMNWQIARSGNTYTLTGGTPYASWPSGGTLTVSFTPPWKSTNRPSAVRVYEIPSAPLVPCAVAASESGGTISVVNTSGAAIALRNAALGFTYAGTIGNVWGTPWMAWSVARSGNAYTFVGGTGDASVLATGQKLTASFTPAAGAHATKIVFEAACGASASPSPSPVPTATPVPTAAPSAAPPGSSRFVGFWESWSDTNTADAYYALASVPAAVTDTDVAFSIADGESIAPAQNAYSLLPGAQAIHAHGGRLLLSFGGATSQFEITDTAAFIANLQAFAVANPGLYDGYDFDDEVMPWNGQQQLVSILNATRAAFPAATISMDAFMSGADPDVALSTHQGEDVAVLAQAGAALSYVNVMDYDQYGWVPSDHPNCVYAAGASDDCRLDVLADFAKLYPASKLVMGLMIGPADDGSVITPADATWYASWVRAHGYGGIMIWDLDRDNPGVTGHADGTYVGAISAALATPAGRRGRPLKR